MNLFLPVLIMLMSHRDKISSLNLEIYDDGLANTVALYNLKKNVATLSERLVVNQAEMRKLANNEAGSVNQDLFPYLLGEIYPTTHHLISDCVLNLPELASIKTLLSGYKLIDFSIIQHFNAKQLALLWEILAFDRDEIERLKQLFNQNNIFLFTGTTLFNDTQDKGLEILRYYVAVAQN